MAAPGAGPVAFVVHMALALIGVVVVFAVAHTDWRGIYDEWASVEQARFATPFMEQPSDLDVAWIDGGTPSRSTGRLGQCSFRWEMPGGRAALHATDAQDVVTSESVIPQTVGSDAASGSHHG